MMVGIIVGIVVFAVWILLDLGERCIDAYHSKQDWEGNLIVTLHVTREDDETFILRFRKRDAAKVLRYVQSRNVLMGDDVTNCFCTQIAFVNSHKGKMDLVIINKDLL